MRGLFLRWLTVFLTLLMVGEVLPGLVAYRDWPSAAVFSVVLALLNAYVRPVLILLTLPIGCLTLGLFTLIINGAVFWLATVLYPAVQVSSFWGAVAAALVVSVVSFILSRVTS